ncbi:MAG: molecular chaperone DnaJ [Aestuariivirga sp.]|uniref:molecular chaperone DnaJ n=1 Tax=Aestuariivirga sp. TaxID=2650926 RepID=UPI0025BCA85C|nr:molecular chaperone DnaJ [Aestuariivirga sp.]MCA3560202.1 molecular chaperone DnaJ [Aestuariivirga sp.]
MAKRDYYDVLGVGRSADEKELKAAYRKLAKQLHPDANPGDAKTEAKFKELNEAYDVLKDPQKKAAYDRFGHQAFENGMGARGGAGFGPDFNSSMSDIFEDLFGDFMGGGGGGGRGRRSGGGRNSGATRGSDLRYNMEISLTEAFTGKSAQIRVPSSVSCEVCSGSGAKSGTSPKTCSACGGQGAVRSQSGFFTVERTCPSCQGRGQVIPDPCSACSGQGRVTRERTLSVNIPAGVEDGTRIRLASEGEAGLRGGPSGDLYIFLSVKPHEFFQRDGADLFCKVPVSMTAAAIGGEIEVPTIDGNKARVSVPEGTQTGKQFRLRNKGMPVLRSSQMGDMYIQVAVETPVNLSRRQKELLKEFEKEAKNNSPESEGFFAKARAFWDGFGS